MADQLATIAKRLEDVVARLERIERSGGASSSSAAASSGGAVDESSPVIADFDALVSEHVDAYVKLSAGLDPLVSQQAALWKSAVAELRRIIVLAQSSKEPTEAELGQLLQPITKIAAQITELREKNRSSKVFNHLSTVSEAVGALGWPAVKPKPVPELAQHRGSSEFYSNRILTEFKGKDENQVAWVRAFNGFLKNLGDSYVKTHHTTGLQWRGQGSATAAAAAAPAAKSAGGPPPPMPAPGQLESKAAGGGDKKPAAAALFAELNKGVAISSGLRKVKDEEKTKNRSAEEKAAASVVKADAVRPRAGSSARGAGGRQRPSGTPKGPVLEGNKWVLEHLTDVKDIVISEVEAKHTVYCYNLSGCVVQVKGKVNSLCIDNCIKTAVVFVDAVATCEIVNCQSVQVQTLGKVPAMSVDKTAGALLVLSRACLDVELVTGTSSEINVSVPGKTDEDDPVEHAIPEQFKSTFANGKFLTSAVEHSG